MMTTSRRSNSQCIEVTPKEEDEGKKFSSSAPTDYKHLIVENEQRKHSSPVCESANSFEDLVRSGHFYADKTQFLFEAKDIKSLGIILPRAFGKSCFFSTVKEFYGIKFNKNGAQLKAESLFDVRTNKRIELFENTSVKKNNKFFTANYGTLPVVSLSFRNLPARDLSTVQRQLQEELRRMIESDYGKLHAALRKKTNLSYEANNLLGIFNLLTKKEKLDPTDLEMAVGELVLYLHRYFDSKCIVMIDEFGAPLEYIFKMGKKVENEQQKDIKDFLDLFVDYSFSNTDHIQLAMYASVSRPAISSLSPLHFTEVSLSSRHLLQYFGYTDHDIYELINLGLIPNELYEQAKKRYNGYVAKVNGGDLCMYNPYSMNCFMRDVRKEKQKKDYKFDRVYLKDSSMVLSVIGMANFRNLEKLCSSDEEKNSVIRKLNLDAAFSLEDCEILSKIENDTNCEDLACESLELLYHLFINMGYLRYDTGTNELRAINDEMRDRLKAQLHRFYRSIIDKNQHKGATTKALVNLVNMKSEAEAKSRADEFGAMEPKPMCDAQKCAISNILNP